MVNSGRKYVTYFDLMKLRCFTKLLEANEFLFTDNGDRVACGKQVLSFWIVDESAQIDQSDAMVNSGINSAEYYKNM